MISAITPFRRSNLGRVSFFCRATKAGDGFTASLPIRRITQDEGNGPVMAFDAKPRIAASFAFGSVSPDRADLNISTLGIRAAASFNTA